MLLCMGKNDLFEQKKTYQKRKEEFEWQGLGKRANIKCRKCEKRVRKMRNRSNCGWNTFFLIVLVGFKKKIKKGEQCNRVVERYGKQSGQGNR